MDYQKKILFLFFLLVAVLLFGTLGYMVILDINFLDALYMTVITLATVGFKEVKELDDLGKTYTIFLILVGFGIFTYSLTVGAQILLEGELKRVFVKRRMKKNLQKLSQHYIICGFGRMGRLITKELINAGIPVVVIEKNRFEGEEEGLFLIEGDATSDEILKEAGIERAKGLISVLPTDAENLYVVLSARSLNPNLFIITRAVEKEAEVKLKRAGANKVVSPYITGAIRMANIALRPKVVDFLEIATSFHRFEIQLEELKVHPTSPLVGKTLSESRISKDFGVIVIGIVRETGEIEFNPGSETPILGGDILIVIGPKKNLSRLEEILS